MKLTATNRVDFGRNVKAMGICLLFAAGIINYSNAQTSYSATGKFIKEQSSNDRNTGTNPVRNNTPAISICPPINVLNMVDMGFDKALVSWDITQDFETIQFRVTDMSSHGSTIIPVHGTPNPGRYFIQGLTALTSYEIEVSTVCNNGLTSPWSAPLTVTTLQPRFSIGNNETETQQRNVNRLHVSPNPANTSTVISFLVAGRGQQNITITSAAGREMLKTSIFPTVDKIDLPVDVSIYPPGVYIVKVSNVAGTSVERLIVQ